MKANRRKPVRIVRSRGLKRAGKKANKCLEVHLRVPKKRIRYKPSKRVLEIINLLKNINLASYPYEEIRDLLEELKNVGLVVFSLHRGKTIIRACLNNDPDESFKTKSRVSYKPAEYNHTYQRASTPNQTMFYGCVMPETKDRRFDGYSRITGFLEISKLNRENIESGKEKITYSRWNVTHDIPLVAIIYHKDFVKKSDQLKEIYNAYKKFLNEYPSEKANSKVITEFLAETFAKELIEEDYGYMISAIFSEIMLRQNFAGIYYPSVRAAGKGFNVAISPDYVDSCMELVAVGECTIYKKGKQIIIDNDTIIELKKGETEFEMQPILDNRHVGEEIILRRLEKKERKTQKFYKRRR